MYHTNFVHLHVHSHYSILDGAASVKSIIDAARRFRMPAIAITDHGNMFAAIDFYLAALKKGVKPILGFEAYLTPGSRFEKDKDRNRSPLHHLVLLAKNQTGYKNIVKLSSLGYTEGFYYKPRIDWDLLEKYHDGIIALGACLQGEVPWKLNHGDEEGARKAVRRYQDVFGRDNFYLEIQNHGLSEQIDVLPKIVSVARGCEVPIVATNDSHYVGADDWEAHDVLLCLQTQTKMTDPSRFRFGTHEFYLKSPQAMSELFREFPDAITNTLRVAERCNVQLALGKSILPHFPIPEGKTSESYLEELCRAAIPRRYPESEREVAEKRLDYELSVIRRMGFCDYFLIVWDFIDQARKMGVPVGPGRGSAAGSIVAYLLWITDLDPIRYALLFERFLNPDRISMPDIDIDFSDEGRQKVIDFVVEKYGREKVSQIITFNQMLAKQAIRGVGRVFEMPLPEVDRIAKMVPEKPGTHLNKVLNEVPELKEALENGSEAEKRLLKVAKTVDGVVSHTGIHAAGVVISRDPLDDIVPMFKDKSNEIVTQYEKNAIEKIGLLKMDFLGLKTLSVIQRALDYIKAARGIDVDLTVRTFDDQATYDLLCRGFTKGVFQLESDGMRNLILKLKPSVFEDIIALLAMYRPGPLGSGMVDDFVECKHGRKKIAYPHPDLEPILKDTYGVFLYQEQCMLTASVMGGFTMGQADQLRKAMAKKITEEMERLGKLFVEGAVKKGIDQALAQSVFDQMASFGEYGFNKSHSAAYAVVTYNTAYLKAHYPTEFMAAVLSSELNDTDKIAEYIDECEEMEIGILPPDINRSSVLYTVEPEGIRYGLSAIKGVGTGAVEGLVEARTSGGPFKSLSDLTRRVDTKLLNSRVLESLIKAGAMDTYGLRRSQLLAMVGDALKSGQKVQKDKSTGQATFFDLLGTEASDVLEAEAPPPDIPEMGERERLAAEKEALGFYLSGDPFSEVAPIGRLFSTRRIDQFETAADGGVYRIAAMLNGVKRITTQKGDIMAFLSMEADNATLDVTLFPKLYAEVSKQLVLEEPLFMVVRSELKGEEIKVNAEQVLTLADLNREGGASLVFTIPAQAANRATYDRLLKLLRGSPGVLPFKLRVMTPERDCVTIQPRAPFRVALTPALIKGWEEICGKHSVSAEFHGISEGRRNNGKNGAWRQKQAAG
ncbi:MAG TPA: DNA polymerase III subunit alpha [Candidatus Ozemobacteraceae bacterium]|nr:DNA polymerase III subunit alpha [Candidatus Ozemobacteraceae bacterium]